MNQEMRKLSNYKTIKPLENGMQKNNYCTKLRIGTVYVPIIYKIFILYQF